MKTKQFRFCIHEYSIYIVISQSIYDMNYLKEETTNDTFLTSFIDYNTEGQSQKASKNYNILLLYDKNNNNNIITHTRLR